MSRARGNSTSISPRWIWPALVSILALYVFAVFLMHPVAYFGSFGDDGVYFSSAKALAEGRGYIMPSFPGRLPGMKYPELYPLILSGIWRLDPNFPSNVNFGVALTLLFGCAFLVLTFFMLRRWPGVGEIGALAVTGLSAFSVEFFFSSRFISTDVPFAAMALGAVWLTDRSRERDRGTAAIFAAGLLAGLSVGVRGLGIAAVAGIWLALLGKREFQRLGWFSVAALPSSIPWLWPSFARIFAHSGSALLQDPDANGWTQTVCYYSSYACNWRMWVTNWTSFKSVIEFNLKAICQAPGLALLSPFAATSGLASLALVSLLSAAAVIGVIRLSQKLGWQPIHAFLLCNLALILPWPYEPERFLIPFYPLLFAGVWLEGKRLASLLVSSFGPGRSVGERALAAAMGLGAIALAALVSFNCFYYNPSQTATRGELGQRLLAERSGAYSWIRDHAAPNANVIADRAGALYLSTGRRAVPPIASLVQSFYQHDPRYIEHDVAHLGDVAAHIHASYWLLCNDDTGAVAEELGPDRVKELEILAQAPVVYRSTDGAVRLYDVRSLFSVLSGTAGLAARQHSGK